MMENPLPVFFGRGVLSQLRSKPSALRRIADAIKPLLMGHVHPDCDPTLGSRSAADISEAHLALKTASPEQIEVWVSEFLTREGNELMKLELRDARRKIEALEARLSTVRSELKQTQGAPTRQLAKRVKPESTVRVVGKALWNWVQASVGRIPAKSNITQINRSVLHHFRVVVQYQNGFYGFEFNLMGAVRRTIIAMGRKDARTAYLFKGDNRCLAKVSKQYDEELLIGSAIREPQDITEGITRGEVSPILRLGAVPVFVGGFVTNRAFHFIDSSCPPGGTIVAFVPIRRARMELKSKPARPTPRQRRVEYLIKREEIRRRGKEKGVEKL